MKRKLNILNGYGNTSDKGTYLEVVVLGALWKMDVTRISEIQHWKP